MTDFEKIMERYIRNQESLIQIIQNNNAQTITRLEVQMSQLTNSQSERPKDTLPSQPLVNPRSSTQVHLAEDQQFNQCNVVHILRSGKKVDNQVSMLPNPIQHNTQAFTSSSSNPFQSDESEKDKSSFRCTSL